MSDSTEDSRYNQWVAPDFTTSNDSSPVAKRTSRSLPTAADIENIFNEAYKEGLNKGYTDGVKKAEADSIKQKKLMLNIINTFDATYIQFSDEVINNIKKMSVLIASQIIRREISIDDSNIISVVQQSIGLMKNIDTKLTIRLNPSDVTVVNDLLSMQKDGNIIVDEDPSITRGGCKLESKSSCIDATIEEQIRIISSEIIGGSRSNDS